MAEENEAIDDNPPEDPAPETTPDPDEPTPAEPAEVVEDDKTPTPDDGKSPFEEFGDPAKKEPKPAPVADPEDADELDKELEAAETKLKADPGDPEALREFTKLSGQVRKRDAKELQQLKLQVRAAAEEAAYDNFERTCGLPDAPADVRKKLSRDVIKDRFQKHFQAELKESGDRSEAIGAAKANLKHEIRKIIAAAGSRKAPLKGKRTDAGASLSPPGGGGGRVPKPKPADEDVFIKGDWTYPNATVGEA